MTTSVSVAAKTKSKAKKPVGSILISQPEPTSSRNPYLAVAKDYKTKIDFRQFISVEGLTSKEFRKQRAVPTDYSGVIFNSRNTIDHFFRLCDELRVKMPQDTKYFCSSETIALYLQKYIQYRKRKVFFGTNGRVNELLSLLKKYKDTDKILFPGSDVRKPQVTDFLDEHGFDYKQVSVIRTVFEDLSDLKNITYDMIVFFSPMGVKSLFHNFPKFKQGTKRIAAFGSATCAEVEASGLRLDVKAPVPEAMSMTRAIINYLEESNK